MAESRDSELSGYTSSSSAIERAQQAINELEEVRQGHHRLGPLSWFAVGTVIVLALVGVVIHTFCEERAPQIDSTSVALLAVALIAPFVPNLKALEVGGAKAEWRESAQAGLKDIVAGFKSQQEAIQKLYDDVGSTIASGAQPELKQEQIDASAGVLPVHGDTGRPPKPLRRVLWFDECPRSSENEVTSLRKFLRVVVATSREQAIAFISRGEVDAVIINEMRGDPDVSAPPPGLAAFVGGDGILAAPRLPLFLYISESLAGAYGAQIDRATVTVVASFSELVRGLRLLEGAALEQFALTVAAGIGARSEPQPDRRVDLVIELEGGERVGIEVASWLKRPQMAAFVGPVGRLADGLTANRFARGILLAQPDLIDERRRQWASEHRVKVIGPDELRDALLGINDR
ncbi:hypothetical protein [Mycolicibacterium vulneris]|uniref:hypothetical protein n=1 Tax=Mycolicibacterium vulneris TaxID=547163 RepID=UPI000A16D782|nr:hypothetical protein [Mycolicibacterium vulneris]